MISVEIRQEDKRLIRIQAIGDNGVQYQVREEIYIAGKAAAVKDHGVISRKKNQKDKNFAMDLIEATLEK